MKQFALFGAIVFGAIGGYLPFLFGNADDMMIWSILGSMVGGFLGIWLGVKVYKYVN